MKLDAVATYAKTLAGVKVGKRWGKRTWLVGEHGFVWERPLGKADLERYGDETPPSGDIIGIVVENLDAKDALLAMELPGFFTIPHFNGYAAVLVELRKARAPHVRAAIKDAWSVVSERPAKRPKKPKRKASR